MKHGVLLFAVNNLQIDYVKQSIYCAKKIKEHLNLPVALGNKFNWQDGRVDSVQFNELTDDEDEINGLHSITLNFSCVTTNVV